MIVSNSHDLLEDAVVNRLKGKQSFAGIEVVHTPDTDKDFNKPFERPRVTVMYTQSQFSEVSNDKGFPSLLSTSEAVQTEFAEIVLNIQARKLREPGGVHDIYNKIKTELFGFKPKSWSRFFLKSFTYVDHKENIWFYAVTFVTSSLVIQCNEGENVLQNTDNLGLIETGDGVLLEEICLTENTGVLITEETDFVNTEDAKGIKL